MLRSNHFYGHSAILARYVGASGPRTIAALMQHGWNVLDGFGPDEDWANDGPKLVWTSTVARRGLTLGRRNYQVVGSAWAYLCELRAAEIEQTPLPEEGTLFYPFHGWERQDVIGDHSSLAAQVRETEVGPVTACLYWLEFENPAIREVYEAAGFSVISHGKRDDKVTADEPTFLDRQFDAVLRHRKVAANRLSTAVWYGASLGREVGVYGDPMQLADEDERTGGLARVRREWAAMHEQSVPRDVATPWARAELGFDQVLDRESLRQTLRWEVDPDESR